MKENSVFAGFDESQIEQLLLAEEKGLFDTDCKNHPEWSSTLMNIHINREADGKSILPVYQLAEYLSTHKIPEDEKSGKLGTNSSIVFVLLEMVDAGIRLPETYPVKEDGTFDKCMFYFNCYNTLELANDRETLMNGRIIMNNLNIFRLGYIFSEGNEKAREVIEGLQQMNSNETPRHHDAHDPMSAISENIWVHTNIVMSVDDMGIRGQQLIDGLEYCDGSIKKLWELVREQDKTLVDYINYKAACRVRDDGKAKEYLAVTSGASFDYFHKSPGFNPWEWRNPDAVACEYRITSSNYEQFLTEIKPLSIDWESMDIRSGINMESAERICKARGFELVRKFAKKVQFDSVDRYYCLFRNKQTGDYIEFGSASLEDVTYGGAKMLVYRVNSLPWDFTTHCSSGPLDDHTAFYYEYTHHEGLFKHYDEIKESATPDKINWTNLGFGSYGLPVPDYWAHPYHRTGELYQKVGGEIAQMWDGLGSYHMQLFINAILMYYDKENFDFGVFPELECFWETPFDYAIKVMGLWNDSSVYETMLLVRLALAWLKAPDELIEECAQAIKRRCDWVYQRELNNAKDNPRALREIKMTKQAPDYYKKYRNMLFKGISNEAHVLEQLELGDIKKLPVKLPWL